MSWEQITLIICIVLDISENLHAPAERGSDIEVFLLSFFLFVPFSFLWSNFSFSRRNVLKFYHSVNDPNTQVRFKFGYWSYYGSRVITLNYLRSGKFCDLHVQTLVTLYHLNAAACCTIDTSSFYIIIIIIVITGTVENKFTIWTAKTTSVKHKRVWNNKILDNTLLHPPPWNQTTHSYILPHEIRRVVIKCKFLLLM